MKPRDVKIPGVPAENMRLMIYVTSCGVGDDGAELVAAVGQGAQAAAAEIGPAAAVEALLVDDGGAVEIAVAGEAEIEGAILGDRCAVAAAGGVG